MNDTRMRGKSHVVVFLQRNSTTEHVHQQDVTEVGAIGDERSDTFRRFDDGSTATVSPRGRHPTPLTSTTNVRELSYKHTDVMLNVSNSWRTRRDAHSVVSIEK